jgi:hypothetical protein
VTACPGFCSLNGYCFQGSCICFANYTGNDCSILVCPTGTFQLTANNTCLPCGVSVLNCATCLMTINQTVSCLTCAAGYVFVPTNNTCVLNATSQNTTSQNTTTQTVNCTGSTFYNATSKSCRNCSDFFPYCSLCTVTNLTAAVPVTCLTCTSGYYVGANPLQSNAIQCLANCSSTGLFLNYTTNLCSYCSVSILNCQTCVQQGTILTCLTCLSGYNLTSFQSNTQINQCTVYVPPTTTPNCSTGYYLNPSINNCSLCSSIVANCYTCVATSNISVTCLTCNSPFVLQSGVSGAAASCVAASQTVNCTGSTFYNATSNSCRNCSDFFPYCSACIAANLTSTVPVTCLMCTSGYYIGANPLQSNAIQCLTNCSSTGLFLNYTTNKCSDCSVATPNCLTCVQQGTILTCLTCLSGYNLTSFQSNTQIN